MTTLPSVDGASPVLTCIVASYNHSPYVIASIEACLRIPVTSKEVIVIDDGSTDGSVALIQDYISRTPHARHVRLIARTNHGLVSSLNHALSVTHADFVFMIASDDLAIPEGVAALLAALQRRPSAGLAFGNALAFQDDAQGPDMITGRPVYDDRHARYFALEPSARDTATFLSFPTPLLIQSTLFRRSALEAVGYLDATIVQDDYPLFIRLLRAYRKADEGFLFMPGTYAAAYRQHAGNTYRKTELQTRMIVEVMERLCPPEIMAEALCRTYVRYSLLSLRGRNVAAARRLFRSACRFGVGRTLVALAREIKLYLDRSKNRSVQETLPNPVTAHGRL
ncbi:MAG: glycosyltransferase family 2 protein [Burkholderiaceae bacterium]